MSFEHHPEADNQESAEQGIMENEDFSEEQNVETGIHNALEGLQDSHLLPIDAEARPDSNSDDLSCATPGADEPKLDDQQARQRHVAKMQKRATTEKKCKCCGTQNTPVWRWGGDAKDTLLCNACSLRIRRSNARPQHRAKSTGERPLKKQNVTKSDGTAERSNSAGEPLSREDIDALRQRLAGFMSQEKARLLGTSGSPQSILNPSWEIHPGHLPLDIAQRPSFAMGPSTLYAPQNWQSTGPYPYGPPAHRPVSQWTPESQPIPYSQIQEDVYYDQHHFHDQEMAYMYAQTTM